MIVPLRADRYTVMEDFKELAMPENSTDRLVIKNFAQISQADITFGDLTVFVGQQASGKSLALQLLKLLIDGPEILSVLRDNGNIPARETDLQDLYFGEGMRPWQSRTVCQFQGKSVPLADFLKGGKAQPARMFYIPAHRALLMGDGWPMPFSRLTFETPTVARLFSQNLFNLMAAPKAEMLFPMERKLKTEIRNVIDAAIFHGSPVLLGKEKLKKRIELKAGSSRLPFMTWTAGQREFTPLLLGLYHLLTERRESKIKDIDWVVIEEPEMGLHPQAISAIMLLALDLVGRGYRVVISTHSPLILDVIFAIRELADATNADQLLCKAFAVTPSPQMKKMMRTILGKNYRTWFFDLNKGKTAVKDISGLDPFSTDVAEADWGGLTGFSGRFNQIIGEAAHADG